jgi:hypothetical protein
MALVKASQLTIGQVVRADMGLGGTEMMENCKITSITTTTGHFGGTVVRFKVKRPCGEVVHVFDHAPNALVEVQEPLRLGITSQQLAAMQRKVNSLEREADAIEPTPIRHEISKRIVEIRKLLRDGHL